MFDWNKDNLINSPARILGYDKTGAEVASEVESAEARKVLLVKRAGEYYGDKICKVFKTEGKEGSPATLTIDCDGIVIAGKEVPQLLQATVKIQMFNKFLGEYANANWALFGKPILAGFEIPETAEDEDVAEALAAALEACVPENNKFMTVELDGSKVVLTLPDVYAYFESFALESYDPTACDSCLGEYVPVKFEDGKIEIVKNVEPFATGEWIRENLRFASYPNMRLNPLYGDEQPIPGAIYTQYSFDYKVDEVGHGGLGFVGQNIVSDTRHVFYVIDSACEAFEAALETAGAPAPVEAVEDDVKASTEDADKTSHLEAHGVEVGA